MTNNELIKELLTYDGYTYKETVTGWYFVREEDQEGYEDIYTFIDLEDYLTDMNILHRIAVKVFCDVLDYKNGTISDVNAICESIKHEFINNPNPQGEHIQLAEALVNAIRYISANKAG